MKKVYIAIFTSNEYEMTRNERVVAISTDLDTVKAQVHQYIKEMLFGNYLTSDDMFWYEYLESEGVENWSPWWEYEVQSKTSNSFYRITITEERMIAPAV